MNHIHQELKGSGFRNNYVGWSALRQLPKIIGDDEEIQAAATGWYDGGVAVIVATSKRIIFLDKKVMSFKVEDIHYEVVSDVQHRLGMFTGRFVLNSASNRVEITSFSQSQIRKLAQFIEARCNDARLNMRTWGEMWQTAQGSEQKNPATPARQMLSNFSSPVKKNF